MSKARLAAKVSELQQLLQRRDEMLVKAQDHALKMGCRATALLAAQGEEPHGYVRVPRRWLDALLPPLAKGVTAGISFSEDAVNASTAIRELMAVAGDEFVPDAAPSALLLAEFRKRLQWYDGVDFVRMADIECALAEALAAEQMDTVKAPRELLKRLTDAESVSAFTDDPDGYQCVFCGAYSARGAACVEHNKCCPVEAARALLGKEGE